MQRGNHLQPGRKSPGLPSVATRYREGIPPGKIHRSWALSWTGTASEDALHAGRDPMSFARSSCVALFFLAACGGSVSSSTLATGPATLDNSTVGSFGAFVALAAR